MPSGTLPCERMGPGEMRQGCASCITRLIVPGGVHGVVLQVDARGRLHTVDFHTWPPPTAAAESLAYLEDGLSTTLARALGRQPCTTITPVLLRHGKEVGHPGRPWARRRFASNGLPRTAAAQRTGSGRPSSWSTPPRLFAPSRQLHQAPKSGASVRCMTPLHCRRKGWRGRRSPAMAGQPRAAQRSAPHRQQPARWLTPALFIPSHHHRQEPARSAALGSQTDRRQKP